MFTLTLQTYFKNALECAPAEGGTAHRLGQDEAYFTVREILAEASTAADGVLWREHSDFCRCGSATLGFKRTHDLKGGDCAFGHSFECWGATASR